MNLYLAVTDNEWFRFLRARPELDEVNFWQPGGGRALRQLAPGAPFLFKLHAPENFIVGGAFLIHTSKKVPLSLAWEAFGEKNGAASFRELRERVVQHRSDEHPDPPIGCLILGDPFFFPESEWIPAGPYWSRGVQQGKYLDLASGPGRELWAAVQERRGRSALLADEIAEPQEVYGEPVLARRRIGQGGFRLLVTDTYHRQCAVTGEKALPTLDAAHIRAVKEGGQHRLDNGLLLRSDVHRLFDAGYVTVTPDHRFRVSGKLKHDFDNGEPYYPFDGRQIWTPPDPREHPKREFLEWHGDVVFRG